MHISVLTLSLLFDNDLAVVETKGSSYFTERTGPDRTGPEPDPIPRNGPSN